MKTKNAMQLKALIRNRAQAVDEVVEKRLVLGKRHSMLTWGHWDTGR